MELIRYTSERVQEIINKSFADKFTKCNMRVDENVDIKNIRINTTTEFGEEIVITLFPATIKATPFIALDKGKYVHSSKLNIEIGLNTVEEKQIDELIMLKNVLPGIIKGIIK